MTMDQETEYALGIITANQDKQFVRRIMNPQAYPAIDNGDGSRSTHLMAYSKAGNAFRVYPTIAYDPRSKKLTKRDGDAAYNHAVKTGDYIDFDTEDEAAWFSRNYKAVWGQ